MIRLTPSQINEKIDFIQNYIKAGNAASQPWRPKSTKTLISK